MMGLLINMISGGVTGYSTNWLAVKMIFKKIGPFGGVIIDTKKEFIENISELVEKEIINHKNIRENLNSQEAKLVFIRIIDEFFEKNIFSELSKVGQNDLKAILLEKVENVFARNGINLEKYIEGVKLEAFFGKEQSDHLSAKLEAELFDFLKKDDCVKSIVGDIYDEFSEFKVKEIVNTGDLEKLAELIIDSISEKRDAIAEIVSREASLIIRDSGFREFLSILIENHVFRDGMNFFGRGIMKRVNEKTPEILIEKEKLNYVNAEILDSKYIDDSERAKLEHYIDDAFESFIGEVDGFIDSKEDELNLLIRQSVLDTMNRGENKGGKIAGMIMSMVSDVESIKKFGIVDKLKEFIRIRGLSLRDQYKSADLDFVYEKLPEKKVINMPAPDVELFSLIDENREAIADYLESERFEIFLKTTISSVLKDLEYPNLVDLSNREAGSFVSEKELQSRAGEKIKSLLESEEKTGLVTDVLEKAKGIELKDFLNRDDFSTANIENRISEEIRDTDLHLLLEETEKSLDNRKWREEIYSGFLNYLNNNLPMLLDGQVSKQVRTNLEKLSDQEIQKVLEDYMGRELKPISGFGAFLGTIAGAGYYFLEPYFTGVSGVYIYEFILYALVGYMTNVIAIWMIFKPYEEKRLLGLKMPFTPGIITKEKERLALSLGEFIERDLLKGEAIQEYFSKNKEKIIGMVLSFIAEKDVVRKLYDENREKILEYSADKAFSFLKAKQTDIVDSTCRAVFEKEVNITEVLKANPNIQRDLAKFVSRFLKPEALVEVYVTNLKLDDLKLEERLIPIVRNLENYKVAELFPESLNKSSIFEKLVLPNIKEKKSLDLMSVSAKKEISKVFRESIKRIDKEEIGRKIVEMAKNNKGKVADEIIGNLSSNPLFSMAIVFLGADRIIREIIEDLVDNKLPVFVHSYETEFEKIILAEIEKFDFEGLLELYDFNSLILEMIEKNEAYLFELFEQLFDSFEDIKISEVLSDEVINKTQMLVSKDFNKFYENPELEDLFEKAKARAARIMKSVVSKSELFDDREIKALFDHLSFEFFESLIGIAIDNAHILSKLDEVVKERSLYFNENYMKKDMHLFYHGFLLRNETVLKDDFSKVIDDVSGRVIDNDLEIMLQPIITAFIVSIESNLGNLIESLKIKELTEKEVREMSSEEIEKMFKSFTGDYLKKLEKYGFSGGIIGVLISALGNLIKL